MSRPTSACHYPLADSPLWIWKTSVDYVYRAYRCSACGWHVEKICPHTGKRSYIFLFIVVVSLGWKQTVALCKCVWVCFFLLSPDLFIKRKTHLHKKALEHRKNVHFVFLSVAPRHVGFQLPLRGFWRLAFILNKAFSHWKKHVFFFFLV